MRDFPLSRFTEFLAPGVDRFSFLMDELRCRGLDPAAVEIAGSRHVVLAPRRGCAAGAGKPVVLVAHYDRAADSPGANDNSAAVFLLAAAAERLDGTEGWRIVFTDREEAAAGVGARGQGSYALAEGLKAVGFAEAEIFIFDACGRGDTIVASTTADILSEGAARARRSARGLRLRALEAGRNAAGGRILLAPTPFSDDAGFLAAGLCAQTITLLPAKEAAALALALRGRNERAAALVNGAARDLLDPAELRSFYPPTWKRLHGASDDAASLTPRAFPLMERYLRALVER